MILRAAMDGAAMGGWAAAGLALAGVLLLRRACRAHRPVPATLAGWGLIALATLGWAGGAAWDKAAALALLAPSLAVVPVLAADAKVQRGRASRTPRAGVEPPSRGGAGWRALVRTLYGGPASGAAALALGAAMALRAPWPEADRLVIAGLLTPLVWALGLIWSTTDPRLGRIGLGLALATLAGGLAAAL